MAFNPTLCFGQGNALQVPHVHREQDFQVASHPGSKQPKQHATSSNFMSIQLYSNAEAIAFRGQYTL